MLHPPVFGAYPALDRECILDVQIAEIDLGVAAGEL